MADENMLVVRFRVYAPNGAARGVLPHPLSWEAGIPLNDMSSLTMTYPDGSDAANMLKSPCEVALELRNPDTGVFVEQPGCRFINIRRSVDMSARPRIISFTMPSYGWQLKKVRFLKDTTPQISTSRGPRAVIYKVNVTAVRPVLDLLDEAKERGNIPGLSYNFTGTIDSAGAAWTMFLNTLTFDFGQDAWSILDSFATQGLFDWRINKRELELFKPDTVLHRMLDTDTGVHIHSGLAIDEPVERTWEDLAARVVALGDNNIIATRNAPESTELPWGKWDETITASGVADRGALSIMADRILATKLKSRTQYTKRFTWTEGSPVPLFDYRPGDYIRATADTTSGAQKASMRVHQVALAGTDPYGVTVTVTLNDRFTERALRTERWVNRGSGSGGPVGGGGTGGGGLKPPPPPPASTPPKTPTLTAVTNEPYFSELGDPVSMADVAFTVVTEDIGDEPIEVARYNVAARRSDMNFQQARVVQVPQPDSPSTGQAIHAKIPNLDSGFTYHFSVQAVRQSGYASEWSNTVSQLMKYAEAAPPVPSAPILSSKLSTVKAEWDGRDNGSANYPASFREVQVEVSRNNTTWFHAGDIFSPGASLIMSGKGGTPTWNVGDTVYVRFKARNSAAVISGPSAVSQIVVTGIVGPDIAANTITANNIVAGTLTAEQIKAHSLSVDRLSVGNPNNLVIDPGYNSAELNAFRIQSAKNSSASLTEWSIANGKIKYVQKYTNQNNWSRFNFINNTLLDYPTQDFPGPTVANVEQTIPVMRPLKADGTSGNIKGRFTVTASGLPASPGTTWLSVALLMRQFTRTGASTQFAGVIRADFQITANGTYTLESLAGAEIPAGAIGIIPYFYIRAENNVANGATLEFSDVEIWQENSVFIGDGRIEAPLIAANAVTTDKLAANAITAKHSIKSAYYEMTSQSGAAVVKITENANYSGQSGIRWDGLTTYGPRMFQVDAAGSGGWDPRGFVITGPEQTTNSSGRVDMQLAYGVTASKLSRTYGGETYSAQGIWWDSPVARFRISGMFNEGSYTNDMFRFGRLGFQNGTLSYGTVTTRRYYPIMCPDAGSTPATASIYQTPDGWEGGFQYVSSAGTSQIFYLAMCGTP